VNYPNYCFFDVDYIRYIAPQSREYCKSKRRICRGDYLLRQRVYDLWTFVPTQPLVIKHPHPHPSWPRWIAAYSDYCSRRSSLRRDGFNKMYNVAGPRVQYGSARGKKRRPSVHPRKGYANNAGLRSSPRRYIIISVRRRRWRQYIICIYIAYTIMEDILAFLQWHSRRFWINCSRQMRAHYVVTMSYYINVVLS